MQVLVVPIGRQYLLFALLSLPRTLEQASANEPSSNMGVRAIIQSLVLNLGSSPGEIRNWPLSMEVKKRVKKEADHCIL